MQRELKNKKILFVLQRNWAVKHGFEIIKKLKNEGSLISTITFKKSIESFVNFQNEIKFEEILSENYIEQNYLKILEETGYNEKKFLIDFNVKSLWEFIHTLRGKATSYKDKFPFSYNQNLDDKHLKSYILAFASKLLDLFNKFTPDLIILYNYGDLRHHLVAQLSKNKKIPLFFMNDTKIKNISAFFYDLNCEKSFFHTQVENYLNGKKKPRNLDKARNYINENRKKIQTPINIKNVNFNIKLFNLEDEKDLLKKIIRKIKVSHEVLDESERISFFRMFENYFFKKKNLYDLKNYQFDHLDQIENFVYLPLQHEPEAMLGMCNPVFDNQLETAKIIARNLPNNYTLVVKNHPFKYFFRSKKYLDKFKNCPNVKVVDHRLSNEIIYKNMKLLISFSGTSIFEAAILKKPAIQIGNLKSMKYLPNIFYLEQLEKIDELIKNIETNFSNFTKTNEYDLKLEYYISAAYDIGFNFEKYEDDLRKNKESLNYIWEIYFKEIRKVFLLRENFNYNF